MTDLRTAVVIDLTGNLERRAKRYSGALGQFSERGRRQMSLLSRSLVRTGKLLESMSNRYTGALAGIGSAYAGYRQVVQSAQLDKQLIQIRQTAGATAKMAAALRTELYSMSRETGQSIDSLLAGFNNLIQAGLSWDQALVTIKAINPAMAVTGAKAEVLSSALTVAGEAFNFDLSKPKLAVGLLDQMVKAGRLGNAELEDLSSIFARVGVNAKAAGLNFSDTLGFIEQLSLIEKQPERLATLADSTLRLFTNQKYLQKAARATHVSFYNAKGDRRAAFAVLADIAAKYKKIRGDRNRDQFISKAFGQADLDTIKGLRALLSGDAIAKARAMSREIAGSTGTIGHDLQDALSNSVDQVQRLKSTLREAADGFAQPINDTIQSAIKYLLDEHGLSGKQLLAGGTLGAAALFAGLKGGGKLLQRFGGVGAGVAAGKALEQVAGVQPVYVVNMPGSGFPGGGFPGAGRLAGAIRTPGAWRLLRAAPNLRTIGAMGSAAMGTAGLAVAAAGGAGYGAGSLLYDAIDKTDFADKLGGAIAQVLANLGYEPAKQAVDQRMNYESGLPRKGGVWRLEVESRDGSKVRLKGMHANDPNDEMEVDNAQGATAW